MKAQRGQSLCEVALGLALIAGLLLFLMAYIAPKMAPLLSDITIDAPHVNTHPVEKHGQAVVDQVDQCFGTRGTIDQMRNPITGRRADICQMENGLYAVEINESNGDNVTKFIKEKLRTLDQVRRYLTNRGYQ